MFVPCDRLNHVGGYVRDADQRPISGATVTFYGVSEQTDAEGCFFFGGALAASRFRVEVTKDGYAPFSEGRGFALYDMSVTLESVASGQASRAKWRKITADEARVTPSCKDER